MDFCISGCEDFVFPVLAATATTHSCGAARVRAARAHARAVRSSEATATTAGVRVLLGGSVARVPLGVTAAAAVGLLLPLLLSVRVPVIVYPSRACARLLFDSLEQSSYCGRVPVSFAVQ